MLRPAQSSLRYLRHRRRRRHREATAPRSARACHPRRPVVRVASSVVSCLHVGAVVIVTRSTVGGFAQGHQQAEEETGQRRSCQPEMSDHGCIHLNNFKAAKGIQPYKVIHSYFVTSTSTEARVRKVRLSFSCVIRGQGSVSVSVSVPRLQPGALSFSPSYAVTVRPPLVFRVVIPDGLVAPIKRAIGKNEKSLRHRGPSQSRKSPDHSVSLPLSLSIPLAIFSHGACKF